MKVSDNGAENSGARRLREQRERDTVWQRLVPYVLTGAIGGGGFSVAMPQIWPGLYRDDPFRGEEGRELAEKVARLEAKTELFLVVGPELVRQNQKDIIEALKDMTSLLREMQREQLRHFQRQDRHGHKE